MSNRHTLVLLLAVSALIGCENRDRPPTPPSQPAPDTTAPFRSAPDDAPSDESQMAGSQFMTTLAETLLGLIQDMRVHPERDAVDTYANAFHWKPTPPEMNALLNAKKGYVGKLGGKVVLLGSDGTRDIISLAVRDEFDPKSLVTALSKVVKLKRVGSDSSMGQHMDIYEIADGGESWACFQ